MEYQPPQFDNGFEQDIFLSPQDKIDYLYNQLRLQYESITQFEQVLRILTDEIDIIKGKLKKSQEGNISLPTWMQNALMLSTVSFLLTKKYQFQLRDRKDSIDMNSEWLEQALHKYRYLEARIKHLEGIFEDLQKSFGNKSISQN